MGIAKSQFSNILNGIFKAGNTIELYSTVPDEATESGGVKISGGSYQSYKIQDGDFSVSNGVATSKKNMLLYLCEDSLGHVARGFGIFSGGSLLYFGSFKTPMPIGYNTVPTIKKYNGAGEGVQITMTSTEISASAE